MTKKSGPAHVVVDGSNIATEGRSMPTLEQLNEAVTSYMDEHPGTLITVVVDATFGHRIPKKEAKAYEEGIANNELVAPPAGAVGRGDAFVLGIADKANASVLSNDSFQEFHGDYPWLFDEGRLVGGKPVPHVGWVFVARVPVRGATSRKATRSSTRSSGRSSGRSGASRTASKAASAPMPVPKGPPPAAALEEQSEPAARSKAPKGPEPVNDLMPFLDFVEHHPVGTSVNGTVDAYSSHGAYVSIGDHGVRAYLPLRLMADPPPRSARKVLSLGESTTLVVVSFAAERRSIDCAFPDMADAAIAAARAEADAPPAEETPDEARVPAEPRKRRSRTSGPKKTEAAQTEPEQGEAERITESTVEEVAPAEPKRRRSRTSPSKKAAPSSTEAAVEPVSDAAPAEVGTADEAAPATTKAKKVPAKKTPAKKRAAKKAPAKKAAAKKAPAKKSAAKKSTAKKAPARKTAAKKTAAKKTPAKKTPAKKRAAKKAPAKKSAARKRAAQPSDPPSSTHED